MTNPSENHAADLSILRIVIKTLGFTGAGIIAAYFLFPGEASIIGVFLIALSQGKTVELLLDRNRQEIWGRLCTPARANFKLAVAMFSIFMAILATYAVFTLLVPFSSISEFFSRQAGDFSGRSITEISFGTFRNIFFHNLAVLLISFLFSLIYLHGGMMLVLAWNASVWGVVFACIARTAPDQSAGGPAVYLLKSLVCILPHLILEALSYILIAMSGVFLSKAIQKYALASPQFAQVGGAVIRISLLALGILVLASILETQVAPVFVSVLF